MTAAVRLRAAAERAPGRRVIVDVADLLEVLAAPPAVAPVELDTLHGPGCGNRARNTPQPPRAVRPPAGRVVMLGAAQDDAERLARAAWETAEDGRRAEHGPWAGADPFLVAGTVAAARRAIEHLLAEAAS